MTWDEKMVNLMREQGKKNTGKGLQLATMESDTKCRVGNLLIDREDYLKAEHLSLSKGDTVVVYKLDDTAYIILEKVI